MGVTGLAEVFGQPSKAMYEAGNVFGRFEMGVTGRAKVFGQPSKGVYEARLGHLASPNGECEAMVLSVHEGAQQLLVQFRA